MRQLEWLFVPTLAGYHLFFKSAISGAILFVAAVGINIYMGVDKPGARDVNLVVFALALTTPLLSNVVYRSGRAARRAVEKAGGLIELLLDEAFRKDLFVEISLRSGKAYIGSVLEPGLGSDRSDIALIPLLSGYRDKDTQELKVTTRYSNSIPRTAPELGLSLNYFRVVMPMGEIVSARIFDLNVARMMAER